MTPFLPYFMENLYHKFTEPNGNNPIRDRSDGFKLIFEILDKIEGPVNIVETGCMRPDHMFLNFLPYGDDGASTSVFDEFQFYHGIGSSKDGVLISIDLNETNIKFAKGRTSPKVDFVHGDSVKELWKVSPEIKFDLVYLDSYDFTLAHPEEARIHQLKELCAVMKNTKPGTLIASDDYLCPGGIIGKGALVKEFFTQIGITPIYEGYQLIYQL